MRAGERWPGEFAMRPVCLGDALSRWSHGRPGLAVSVDGSGPTYCFVWSACEQGQSLVLGCRSRALATDGPRRGQPVLDLVASWELLASSVIGSTRQLDEHGAGLYRGSVLYRCSEGWARIILGARDPESLASIVLRDLVEAVGERPSVDALRLAVLTHTPKYIVTLAPGAIPPLQEAA